MRRSRSASEETLTAPVNKSPFNNSLFFLTNHFKEMWFIYVLSWLSLVIQICFVTLAIGEFRVVAVSGTANC